MKKLILMALLSATVFAKVNVATTYQYLGEVVKAIGADEVKVDVLANPKLDPHFIVPKPSYIGKLRREDLLIINGGQLEIGWLPPLIKSANNQKIQAGEEGFLDVSRVIQMLDKPKSVSRAYGDIHPDGNPHFATDIHSIIPIATLIARKLEQIDTAHKALYKSNLKKFITKYKALISTLNQQMKSCKGHKVVQYHELFNYALHANGITSIGTLEPLPGISPSSKHTLMLINLMKKEKIKTILQDVYHEKKTAKFIADKTGATIRIVPHDVGATREADTLENFYKSIAKELCL